MKKRFAQLVTGIAAISVLLPVAQASAVVGSGQAHLSLSTDNSSYVTGSTAYVTVQETSSVAVAGVEADFSYNPAQLQYLSTDTSASAFNTYQPSSGGNGSVTIARTEQGGTFPTGSAEIAVVSFRVLASSGVANLTILGSSDIDDSVSAASLCDSSCAGGNIAATFQMTAPTSTQPSQTSSPTGSAPTTNASKPATTSNSTAKPTTSTAGNTSTTSATTTSTTSSASTSQKTSTPTPKSSHTSSHHTTFQYTGLIMSGVAILVIAGAGLYWFYMRKTPAVAPQKKYSARQQATKKANTRTTRAKATKKA